MTVASLGNFQEHAGGRAGKREHEAWSGLGEHLPEKPPMPEGQIDRPQDSGIAVLEESGESRVLDQRGPHPEPSS